MGVGVDVDVFAFTYIPKEMEMFLHTLYICIAIICIHPRYAE